MSTKEGVAVFVLRPGDEHRTEVLLLERALGDRPGSWSPVAGRIEDGEGEAAAALRELHEETALVPQRFYAAPFSGVAEHPETGAPLFLGIFVARVAVDAAVALDVENASFAWLSREAALERLPLEGQRSTLDAVWQHFVQRPPDEALRIR